MSDRQTINCVNYVFCTSLNTRELQASQKTIDALLQRLRNDKEKLDSFTKNTPSTLLLKKDIQENLENAEALSIRLKIKTLAYEYFFNGYENYDYEALSNALTEGVAESENYIKTNAVCMRMQSVLNGVYPIMSDAVMLKYSVLDGNGNQKAETSAISEALKKFERKLSDAEKLSPTQNIFSENVKFPDIKSQIINDLQEIISALKIVLDKAYEQNIKGLIADCTVRFNSVFKKGSYEYYPCGAGNDKNRTTNALILCSPFEEELFLYIDSVAKKESENYVLFYADTVERNSSAVAAIFKYIQNNSSGCVVSGLNRCRSDEYVANVLRAAVMYGKSGKKIYITDTSGNGKLYEKAFKIAEENSSMSISDVCQTFITMPDFVSFVDVLKDTGMKEAAEIDSEDIRRNLTFSGYIGLNDAYCNFCKNGAGWYKKAVEFSAARKSAALEYIRKIPCQLQFADIGWGDFTYISQNESNIGRKSFDYDAIRTVNHDNLKLIIEHRCSLFSKCGMAVRYCMLGGDDFSVWKDLSYEEKSERLTQATRAVMMLLSCDVFPEVKVVKNDEWEKSGGTKGAAGQCCNGGKLIQYKEQYVKDYEFTAQMVCHECFHGFQHYSISNGYRDWFFTELGVTMGRISEWKNNFDSGYISIPDDAHSYRVQIVEGDANAFENDCFVQGNNEWNSLELK